jgi:hypothetical protein
MEIKNDELLNRKSACSYLGGICLTTLGRLKIPQVRIRRRVLYRKKDLEKWIAEQIVKPEGKK